MLDYFNLFDPLLFASLSMQLTSLTCKQSERPSHEFLRSKLKFKVVSRNDNRERERENQYHISLTSKHMYEYDVGYLLQAHDTTISLLIFFFRISLIMVSSN